MNGDAFPSNGEGSRTGETALSSFQEEEQEREVRNVWNALHRTKARRGVNSRPPGQVIG